MFKKNPQSYFGPFLDRQETADLIDKYVDSHMVFIFQGIPPSYLQRIYKYNVLAIESAYADDVVLDFKVWYPSAGSTVPTLKRSPGGRVYGYVAFMTLEGLESFDSSMGTEIYGGEHWHKRVRTLVTLPQRPQPNRVRAWSYRATKPSFAPRKKRRYVPREYKQAMADMLNESGWKHDDGKAVTWKDVEEGQSPVHRNPYHNPSFRQFYDQMLDDVDAGVPLWQARMDAADEFAHVSGLTFGEAARALDDMRRKESRR